MTSTQWFGFIFTCFCLSYAFYHIGYNRGLADGKTHKPNDELNKTYD